jgi:hypothetical protein
LEFKAAGNLATGIFARVFFAETLSSGWFIGAVFLSVGAALVAEESGEGKEKNASAAAKSVKEKKKN